MFNYPGFTGILLIFLLCLGLINKVFLMKGGIILKMDGVIPNKAGIRKEHSKYSYILGNIIAVILIIWMIDVLIQWVEQEGLRKHYK